MSRFFLLLGAMLFFIVSIQPIFAVKTGTFFEGKEYCKNMFEKKLELCDLRLFRPQDTHTNSAGYCAFTDGKKSFEVVGFDEPTCLKTIPKSNYISLRVYIKNGDYKVESKMFLPFAFQKTNSTIMNQVALNSPLVILNKERHFVCEVNDLEKPLFPERLSGRAEYGTRIGVKLETSTVSKIRLAQLILSKEDARAYVENLKECLYRTYGDHYGELCDLVLKYIASDTEYAPAKPILPAPSPAPAPSPLPAPSPAPAPSPLPAPSPAPPLSGLSLLPAPPSAPSVSSDSSRQKKVAMMVFFIALLVGPALKTKEQKWGIKKMKEIIRMIVRNLRFQDSIYKSISTWLGVIGGLSSAFC